MDLSDLKPIETAPRDGEIILACHMPTHAWWLVSWRNYPAGPYTDGMWQIKAMPGRDPITYFQATHWVKLPDLPL